jgi:uncharacterized protein with PIN domain
MRIEQNGENDRKECSNCGSTQQTVKHKMVRDSVPKRQDYDWNLKIRKHGTNQQGWKAKSLINLVDQIGKRIMKRGCGQILSLFLNQQYFDVRDALMHANETMLFLMV